MRTIQQMVDQEVMCCMSSLVSTLAETAHSLDALLNQREAGCKAVTDLSMQAYELAAPVPDYEEAAIQAGWRIEKDDNGHKIFVARTESDAGAISDADPNDACGWEALCRENDLEPIDSEVFEHWAVSQWLAEKLIEQGEKVDKDFAGLNVWARQTTGQQISADHVIERIYAATHQKEEA